MKFIWWWDKKWGVYRSNPYIEKDPPMYNFKNELHDALNLAFYCGMAVGFVIGVGVCLTVVGLVIAQVP